MRIWSSLPVQFLYMLLFFRHTHPSFSSFLFWIAGCAQQSYEIYGFVGYKATSTIWAIRPSCCSSWFELANELIYGVTSIVVSCSKKSVNTSYTMCGIEARKMCGIWIFPPRCVWSSWWLQITWIVSIYSSFLGKSTDIFEFPQILAIKIVLPCLLRSRGSFSMTICRVLTFLFSIYSLIVTNKWGV